MRIISPFLLFICFIFCQPLVSHGKDIYLVTGLNVFAPYNKIKAEIYENGDNITGKLYPPLGDKRQPKEFSGSTVNGEITLQFDTGSLVLKKTETADQVQWVQSVNFVGANGEPITFFKLKNGVFSDSAQNLDPKACGPHYGGLQVDIKSDYILHNSGPPKELEELELHTVSEEQAPENVSKLKFNWFLLQDKARLSGDTVSIGVIVEPGSELDNAVTLRSFPFVQKVTLIGADCGGSDVSLIIVKKNVISNQVEVDQNLFTQYFNNVVSEYIGQREKTSSVKTFRIENTKITRSPIRPHLPKYKTTVFTDAFVTRDKKNAWDKFDIIINLMDTIDNKSDELSAEVFIENYYTVPKAGKKEPPSAEWFNTKLDGDVEASVTYKFGNWFARHEKTACEIVAEGSEWPACQNETDSNYDAQQEYNQ